MKLHPVCLLLFWGAGFFFIQTRERGELLWVCGLLAFAALICAPGAFRRLLRRTRWLFLTLLALFLFMTPGLRLPGVWGSWGWSYEGVGEALDHGGRLLANLAALVLLLRALGRDGLVEAIYWIPAHCLGYRTAAGRLAVRLTLVMENVQRSDNPEWRTFLSPQPADEAIHRSSIELHRSPWRWLDTVCVLVLVSGLLWFLMKGQA